MSTRWLFILATSAVLAACGGGGGGESGSNTPPQTESETGTPPAVHTADSGPGGDDGSSRAGAPAPGPLTGIQFNAPTEIAIDGRGNLYVLDREEIGERIRHIAPDGNVTTLVSTDENLIGPITVAENGD